MSATSKKPYGVLRWFDADETARHLGMTRRGVYMAVRRGQVPVHRLGRRLRFDLAEVDAALTR